MAMLMMVGFANKQHIKNPHTGSSCWTPAHCTDTDTGSSGVIANMHPSSVYMSAKSSTSSSLSSPSSTSTNIHDYNADLNVL